MDLPKQLDCKILYYGPRAAGKKTNVNLIYTKTPEELRGRLIATENGEVVLFELMPLKLDVGKGISTRLQLCMAPWQSNYRTIIKLLLHDIDGIIFIADSRRHKLQENINALKNLERELQRAKVNIHEIPLIIQWNKRDCRNIMSVEELENEVNYLNVPSYEASAAKGKGVYNTLSKCALSAISKKVLRLKNTRVDNKVYQVTPNKKLELPQLNSLLAPDIGNHQLLKAIKFPENPPKIAGIAALKKALSRFPQVFVDLLLFECSFSENTLEAIVDRKSKIDHAGNIPIIASEGICDCGELNTIGATDNISEIIAERLLPDFEQIKAESNNNENAYFKLELIKSLINYRDYYRKYYLCINQNRTKTHKNCNPKTINDRENFSESCFVALESESVIFQFWSNHVSFWHIFDSIIHDKPPQLIILNYIHLLLRHFLARKGIKKEALTFQRALVTDHPLHKLHILLKHTLAEKGMTDEEIARQIERIGYLQKRPRNVYIFARYLSQETLKKLEKNIALVKKLSKELDNEILGIIRKIAMVDIFDKLSLAGMRNYYKEFVLEGIAKSKTPRGEKSMVTFHHFDNTPQLRNYYQVLFQCQNRNEFYPALQSCLATILGPSNACEEVNKLFYSYDLFELKNWEQNKEEIIRNTLEDILATWLSPRFYSIFNKQLGGEIIGIGDIYYIKKLRQCGKHDDWISELFLMNINKKTRARY